MVEFRLLDDAKIATVSLEWDRPCRPVSPYPLSSSDTKTKFQRVGLANQPDPNTTTLHHILTHGVELEKGWVGGFFKVSG